MPPSHPSPFDFDEILDRRQSESFKWREYDPEVLPLFIADMDFRSPQPVADALDACVRGGVFGYPRGLHAYDKSGLTELLALVADRMNSRFGWRVSAEAVVTVPGVIPGLNVACHALGRGTGGVLVQPPVYPPILSAPFHASLERHEAPLRRRPGGGYEIDWDVFEQAITPATRMFILCNPHNPVGRVFRRDELERMASVCLERGLLICSDEIHSDLVFPGHPHIPIASLSPEVAARTITLVSPSKTFNLAGLQCGFAIIPDPALRRRFQVAREGMVPWVNLMGVLGAEAAYRHGGPWLDALLRYLQENRDFVVRFAAEHLPGVTANRPEGTYMSWLHVQDVPGGMPPLNFVLDRARVALSDGRAFGSGGEGFLRLNFACPRRILEDALRRWKRALETSESP